MKKLLFSLLFSVKVCGMEPAVNDIATKIASIIEQYDSTSKADDSDFKALVTSYFTRESEELEAHVMPLFTDKLKAQDAQIAELMKAQDKDKLEAFVSGLITESLEEAFKNQSDRFTELKALADEKLQKTRYALVTAVVSGVLGVAGTIALFYFH